MNIKKFLAIILSVMIISTLVISASAEVQYSDVPTAMPEPVTDEDNNPVYIVNEAFNLEDGSDISSITYSSTNTSGRVVANTNHAYSIKDGALIIESGETGSSTITLLSLGTGTKPADNLVVEFDLIRNSSVQIMLGLSNRKLSDGGSSNYLPTRLTFNGEDVYVTNNTPTTHSDTYKGNSISPNGNFDVGQKLHCVIEYTDDYTWSLWVNGERWVDNEPAYGSRGSKNSDSTYTCSKVSPSSMTSFYIRTQSKNAKLTIDNFKAYQSKKRIEGKAEYTGELVAEGALNTSVKMIDLPETKTIGAAILAVYNETEGAKSLADIKLVSNPELTDGVFTIGIDSLAEDVTAESELKLFIFEGTGNIVPITLPVTVKAQ